MAMTNQQQTEAYQFFAIAFGATPGVEYMTQLDEAYSFGLTTQQIVNIYTTKPAFTAQYPTFYSNEQFANALVERDTEALAEQVEQAREKAYRAPLLLLVVVDGARGDASVDLHERIVSAGCAVQNMLLMATSLGYGSALTSGKALKSQGLRSLFALAAQEHALYFVSVGTVQSRKPQRSRPTPADYVAHLTVAQGVVSGLPLQELPTE